MARPGPAAGFEKISHPQKRALLRSYSLTMRLGASCEAAKIQPWTHYHWLKIDPTYAEAFTEAKAQAADTLEDEAVRRARQGVERVLFHQGQPIGTEHVYSDTLLIFLLKGAKPDTYKERYEHTGKGGGPIQLETLTSDQRQTRLAALLTRRQKCEV